MASTQGNNTPKIILLVVAIVAAVSLAVWKGGAAVAGNPDEVTFKPKVQAKGDGDFVRTGATGAPREDKTGGGE